MKNNVIISHNLKEKIGEFLSNRAYSQYVILVDDNTERDCLHKVLPYFENAKVISIPHGEEEKNLTTCINIWQQMTDFHLDRKALMINLGGGVIGDMGGFCASTYKRGIEFIQIPTTLLSQVDASVGGKLGVDFKTFKNHIGVFNQPQAVFIDTDFLETLDPREIRSGFAEIIKHCLIKDAKKWKEIIQIPYEKQDWEDLNKHSVAIKEFVTENDPEERGLRKILNFGHTIGHAIESFNLEIALENNIERKFLHGEAIAIGMICESFVAKEKGFISDNDLQEIAEYIIKIYGHHPVNEEDFEEIISLTIHDKKNENNIVLASLLEEVGNANFNQPLSAKDIKDSILYYNQLI
ncbi:MAG: 3-dehydroquinate synthase [Cytophagales bacterium]|nr:3-dehydroquinate synthase [Cytophagales bacterium]